MGQHRFTDPAELKAKINRIEHSMIDGALFLDVILAGLRLRSYAELSRSIEVTAPVLSRIRGASKNISDSMLLALHEEFDLPIADLKQLVNACVVPDPEGNATHERARYQERIRELAGAAMFAPHQSARYVAVTRGSPPAQHGPAQPNSF